MAQRAVWLVVALSMLVSPLAVGCAGPGDTMTSHRDTGVGSGDAAGLDSGDSGLDSGVVHPDANLPHDAAMPTDTNMMEDAVGGGAGLMCTACTTNADCRAGSFCVQLASSGDRVCLQNCNAEIPSCPHRFDCLNSVLTPTAGPVCTPVGERCCIDADEDDHGFGVGCRGTDCNDSNPAVYQGAHELCNNFDDNCDGVADDGNPQGGNLCVGSSPGVCSSGMTMCLTGAIMCVPTVTVGSMTEVCNGLDDDCDGPIDEGFAFMGDPLFPAMSFPLSGACAIGLGACRRSGAVVCAPGGASAMCNAPTALGSVETCNYLDDDCNGTTDDGFRDASGIYNADADCGACGIDCTMIYAHPGSFGTCRVAAGRATCALNCNVGAFNLNGIPDDGCEFALDATAIYVSGEDPGARDDTGCGLGPVASGGGNYPCRTITYGQGRAMTTARTRVLVADALYLESIVLVNGQSLLGGYRADTWERHLTTTLTTIRGASGAGHRRAITAGNITMATVVEGFVIEGASATSAGANSYAVYVSGGTSALVFRSNVIYAGAGAPGSPGIAGTDGLGGVPGAGGAAAFDTGTSACGTSSAGGAGGARVCAVGGAVSGGAGGQATCPMSWANPGVVVGSSHGGVAGSGIGGGGGGVVAYDGQTRSIDQCFTCYLGGGGTLCGGDGAAGASGTCGGGGGGAGGVSYGIYVAGTSGYGAGTNTFPASGGGGGGGGGGPSLGTPGGVGPAGASATTD